MRVEVTSLESGYGSATVLRGTDLRVDDGAALAVVGRNGMGKTTLLRTILGYLRPSAGTVALDGVDVTGWLPERVVRRGVGYGPQDEAVFADLSVADNLAASSHRTDPRRRAEVLDHFPTIGQRLRQRAGTLSGGEQKMLTLCRVLLEPAPAADPGRDYRWPATVRCGHRGPGAAVGAAGAGYDAAAGGAEHRREPSRM